MRSLGLVLLLPVVLTSSLCGQGVTVMGPSKLADPNMPSILVPPIAGKAFSATVQQWDRSRGKKSSEYIARDDKGRVVMEFYSAVADTDCNDATSAYDLTSGPGYLGVCTGEPWLVERIYLDPVKHAAYECIARGKTCHAYPFEQWVASMKSEVLPSAATGPVVDLGQKEIDKLNATGTRRFVPGSVLRYVRAKEPTQVAANIARDVWYSAELGIDVEIEDQRFHSFAEVKKVKLGDPNAGLFALPKGYRVVP